MVINTVQNVMKLFLRVEGAMEMFMNASIVIALIGIVWYSPTFDWIHTGYL